MTSWIKYMDKYEYHVLHNELSRETFSKVFVLLSIFSESLDLNSFIIDLTNYVLLYFVCFYK